MPRKTASLHTLALLALLALLGCAAGARAADVVAKAGPVELTTTDVEALVAALPDSSRAAIAADPRVLEQVVRNELVRRAVMEEVRAANFAADPKVAAQLERLRDEALMRLWIAEKSRPPATFPSEAEVQAAYEGNRQAFAAAPEYRIAQVFISAPDGADPAKLSAALAKAQDVARRLPTGDFAMIARTDSEHAESAPQGGDLGFLPENRLLPEVAAAVRGLPVGQTVGPVKTAQGLHFLKLLEKKEGQVPDLSTIRDSVAAAMRDARARQLEQAYLADLGRRLGISINQIELAKLQPTLR